MHVCTYIIVVSACGINSKKISYNKNLVFNVITVTFLFSIKSFLIIFCANGQTNLSRLHECLMIPFICVQNNCNDVVAIIKLLFTIKPLTYLYRPSVQSYQSACIGNNILVVVRVANVYCPTIALATRANGRCQSAAKYLIIIFFKSPLEVMHFRLNPLRYEGYFLYFGIW